MKNIKIREKKSKNIKLINKNLIVNDKLKYSIVEIKNKNTKSSSQEENINEYGSNKITNITAYSVDKGSKEFNRQGQKVFIDTKNNIQKSKIKIKAFKNKLQNKRSKKNTGKKVKTAIKTSKELINKTEKVAKQSVKTSQKSLKFAKSTTVKTIKGLKVAVKTTISSVKAIIASTKALISVLIAGGWVAVIAIVVICLVGLLCSSIFGIFLSSEKTSSNATTMKDVVYECNQEFSNKLQSIQDSNPHDEYVLDGSMASWKDILLTYTIKQSNGNNQQDVVTMDNNKKSIIKRIFWDMNNVSFDIRDEQVIEQGINTEELPNYVQKRVLHIQITSKTAEQMKNEYHFDIAQINQYNELSSPKYSSLWNGAIYGSNDTGEYVDWRQGGMSWSNIKIGNTSSTIGQIGCLVTSISILIEKSGVNNSINPFNPGIFVDALNKNNGFDSNGNLQYGAISKVVPEFKYVGKVDLRGKTRMEKLSLINQYFNSGYYITAEVKGATPGNQHWVAITGIDGNNITMIDPGSNQKDMWSAYEFNRTSQFNYFSTH